VIETKRGDRSGRHWAAPGIRGNTWEVSYNRSGPDAASGLVQVAVGRSEDSSGDGYLVLTIPEAARLASDLAGAMARAALQKSSPRRALRRTA
jgi:hypothetical protein